MAATDCRMKLTSYTKELLDSRDVTPEYRKLVSNHIENFQFWMGALIDLADIASTDANAWIADLLESGRSPHTVDSYRRSLLTVWKEAYRERLIEESPLRLRSVRKPRRIVEAYTHAEIMKLLASAAILKGWHRDGPPAKDYWTAAILLAYYTGLRRGDLWTLKRSQLRGNTIRIIQHKTGHPVPCSVPRPAMDAIEKLDGTGDLILPWPYAVDQFGRRFHKIRIAAGVKRGTFKWIRRSAGSYAEREQPGAGARLLGHKSDRTFQDWYNDTSISQVHPISPPPLS